MKEATMAVYIETKTKDELLARLSGEIDHHSSLWLRMDIDTAICENKPKTLQLDFSDVSFMDSSGVGLVMGRYKLMKEIGGSVELCNLPDSIERVMLLAGMNRICKIK